VEVSALTHTSVPGLAGPSPLLRLQSDERLIALTRRGQHAAFEALCSRYQSRLLSFCRHMLNSREDAEDVLQEVFAAAFNAILADEREINVRPWLYRIARNRSLNHLRRASAIGVDSMDVHYADNGLSTGEQVIRRESFRNLLSDVQQLPESQRTALLLREIDALSYEQIAHAMETTVPSVKSLLVRARIGLAEAAEARKLSCAEVRLELGEVAEGLAKLSVPVRRHVRDCERCRFFRKQLKHNNHALAAILPVGPLLLAKKLLLTKLGSTASAGSAHVAGGAGATVGAGAGTAAGAGASGGAGVGILTAGTGAIATKAVAGLAAAAIVTAGAVAADHATSRARVRSPSSASAPALRDQGEPVVVSERPQPVSSATVRFAGASAPSHYSGLARKTDSPKLPGKIPAVVSRAGVSGARAPATAPATKPVDAKPALAPLEQVTTETTQLPAAATAAASAAAAGAASTAAAAQGPTGNAAPAPSSAATPPPPDSEPTPTTSPPAPVVPPETGPVRTTEQPPSPPPQQPTTTGEGPGATPRSPGEGSGDSGQGSAGPAGS
jgi:RNA polymerase sigma factor (sigma-70 family)